VSWSENLENNEIIIRQQREIQELREQMIEISREFRSIKELVQNSTASTETSNVDKKPIQDVNLV
jgi:hypothetical protein